ncbi:toll-like receptor 4 [Sitophilus oryzae]|uniref:Toll-like receptor 4 n=1 Tax=Sitophilus oryzae TaxID=7048 RepID=A0A6J2XH47_SITOR|nr:toll-like receptor 4 [Sitophilus oryzae]
MIWRYFCFHLLIYYHPIGEIKADKSQPICYEANKDINLPKSNNRYFKNLEEYKANTFSFSYERYCSPSQGCNPMNLFPGNFVTILNLTSDVLETGAFEVNSSDSIISLNLSSLFINEIHSRAFASLTCLHYLNLSDNKIVELQPEQWFGLDNLKTLELRKNNIIHLKPFTFRYLKKLQSLDLSLNDIVYIDDFSFNYLISLKSLSLAYNYLTSIYQNYIFVHLTNLEHLDLSHNSLSAVSMAKFRPLEALQSLNFSNNNMAVFDLRETFSFFEFPFLKLLNLTGNYLDFENYENLPERFTFDNLTIDINENPVHCYYIEKMLNLFQDKVRLAPGRYFGDETRVNRIRCENMGMTEEDVNYLNKFYDKLRIQHYEVLVVYTILIVFAIAYILFVYYDHLQDHPCFRKLYGYSTPFPE